MLAVFSFALNTSFAGDAATKDEVVKKVNEAIALIEKEGPEKAFPKIRDKKYGFFWKDTYVFVLDFKGNILVHPANPALEKGNWMKLQDKDGKFFVVEMIKQVKKGPGWIDYKWPRAGGKEAAQKTSYVKPLKGKEIFAGAGIYKD
jgi:signal transduction histidine kinase